jgi:diguanylate cyclase (GGDEF)-like protein
MVDTGNRSNGWRFDGGATNALVALVVQAIARATVAEAHAAAAEVRAMAAEARAAAAEQQASTDALTGVLNSLGWRRAMTAEEARAQRSGRHTVVVVADVDDLKAINDCHGHLAGDLLLRQAADCLRAAVRPHDQVARIGGDEFAILVVDYEGDGPEAVVGRIDRELAEQGVSASVGAALHRPPDRLAETYALADQAMYAAKRRRKRQALRAAG